MTVGMTFANKMLTGPVFSGTITETSDHGRPITALQNQTGPAFVETTTAISNLTALPALITETTTAVVRRFGLPIIHASVGMMTVLLLIAVQKIVAPTATEEMADLIVLDGIRIADLHLIGMKNPVLTETDATIVLIAVTARSGLIHGAGKGIRPALLMIETKTDLIETDQTVNLTNALDSTGMTGLGANDLGMKNRLIPPGKLISLVAHEIMIHRVFREIVLGMIAPKNHHLSAQVTSAVKAMIPVKTASRTTANVIVNLSANLHFRASNGKNQVIGGRVNLSKRPITIWNKPASGTLRSSIDPTSRVVTVQMKPINASLLRSARMSPIQPG